jgi:tetratricopeptide (TPR) repeat protein
MAARRLAGNVGIVREVAGIAAYRTERWTQALEDLNAARQMTGRLDYLAVIADSERALGRLDRALKITRSPQARRLPRNDRVELRIVESGILRDQGRPDAAVLALQVPELRDAQPWSARLFYAYAEALLAAGRTDEALRAFTRSAAHDPDGETDAVDRIREVTGNTITVYPCE